MGWIKGLFTRKPKTAAVSNTEPRTIIMQEDDAPPIRMNPRLVPVSFVSWPLSIAMPEVGAARLINDAMFNSQEAFWISVMSEDKEPSSYFIRTETPDNPNDVLAALATLEVSTDCTVVLIPMKIPALSLEVYGGFCVEDSGRRLVLPYDGGVVPT